MRPRVLVLHAVVLLVIALITLAPVISVAFASAVAEVNGCTLDESQAHPCIINGVDQGGNLYTLGMLGWFMLVTLPVGGLIFIAYLLILLVYVIVRKRRQARSSQAGLPAH